MILLHASLESGIRDILAVPAPTPQDFVAKANGLSKKSQLDPLEVISVRPGSPKGPGGFPCLFPKHDGLGGNEAVGTKETG